LPNELLVNEDKNGSKKMDGRTEGPPSHDNSKLEALAAQYRRKDT